jgi:membrane protein YdbS with pleckstrin-like domain
MISLQDRLFADERIIHHTGLHWTLLFGPGILIVIGGLSIPSKGLNAVILVVIGVVWTLLFGVSLQRSELAVTQKRILVNMGFLWKRTYDIPLDAIAMIDTYQPTLGKILDFGKIMIRLAKGRRYSFRMVRAPGAFVQKVREQIALRAHEG